MELSSFIVDIRSVFVSLKETISPKTPIDILDTLTKFLC